MATATSVLYMPGCLMDGDPAEVLQSEKGRPGDDIVMSVKLCFSIGAFSFQEITKDTQG